VICHGIPDTRPLEDGDIVNLDVSIFTPEGFHSDLNETFIIGAVNEKGQRLVMAAYESLRSAVAVCKPGVMYRDLGAVIKRAVDGVGPFSIVQTYCGHGVGRMFHCESVTPRVLCLFSAQR
jgi:methionyl aminopeptidase